MTDRDDTTSALSEAVASIVAAIPAVLEAGVAIVEGLIQGLVSAAPGLIAALIPGLLMMVDSVLTMLPMLLTAAVQIVLALAQGITQALPTLIPARALGRDGATAPGNRIGVGVIGLGAEGGLYANLISGGKTPHVEIGAICDILPEKKARADELGERGFDPLRRRDQGIAVNGQPRDVSATTVAELVKEVTGSETGSGIAVAIGEDVLTRAEWENPLVEGAVVEILTAVQGG